MAYNTHPNGVFGKTKKTVLKVRYRFTAKGHRRGQQDLSFLREMGNTWDALIISSRLRATGYETVHFQRLGIVSYPVGD